MNEEIRNDVIEETNMEKKETLLDKGKNLCKAGLGKAKDAGKWIKENPVDAVIAGVGALTAGSILISTAAGLKYAKKEDERSEELYQATKEKLENEKSEEKVYYIVK